MTGKKLERCDQKDFLDIVYQYGVNSGEHRGDFRTAMLGYLFDFTDTVADEDDSFTGNTQTLAKQIKNKSLLDELDAFTLG